MPKGSLPSGKDLARLSPGFYAEYASGGWWQAPPHLRVLDQALLRVTSPHARVKRLLVMMPPRHGKSELCSHYLPVWFLLKYPEKRVILTSYGDQFAATWGRKTRDTMEVFGPEFGLEVNDASSAANRWDLRGHRGGLSTAGVGSGITGKGAHLLIVDDPVKDAAEAASETYRDAAWDWWRATARTRVEPGGAVVVIQTRWHEDDLAGCILEAAEAEGAEPWEVLSLPALAEEHEEIAGMVRAPGDALWPERYDEEALRQTRQALGAYHFSALFQQRPSPEGGETFQREHFRYFADDQLAGAWMWKDDNGTPYRYSKDACSVFHTVDLAMSTKETADWTVIATWALVPHTNTLLLLNVDRRRMQGPDIVPALQAAYRRYGGVLHVESAGFGIGIIQEATRTGLPIRELKADVDKLTRSRIAQANVANGLVRFLWGASWLQELEAELLAFPNGRHDDQVDVLSYAAKLQGFGTSGVGVVPGFLNRAMRRGG